MKKYIVLAILLLGMNTTCFATKPVNYDDTSNEQMTLKFNVVSGSDYIPIQATMTGKAIIDDDEGERMFSETADIGTVDGTPATKEEIAELLTMGALQTLYCDWYDEAIDYEIELEE